MLLFSLFMFWLSVGKTTRSKSVWNIWTSQFLYLFTMLIQTLPIVLKIDHLIMSSILDSGVVKIISETHYCLGTQSIIHGKILWNLINSLCVQVFTTKKQQRKLQDPWKMHSHICNKVSWIDRFKTNHSRNACYFL